jgi:hypothetical protein
MSLFIFKLLLCDILYYTPVVNIKIFVNHKLIDFWALFYFFSFIFLDGRFSERKPKLGVTDVRFDALEQLRRHLPDAVFLGVLSRFLEYLLFRLTPYDVLTPARRVYFGAF